MKRWTWLLAALCLGLTACRGPIEPDLSAYETSGTAQVPSEEKYIALTFDDGPRRGTTEKLLQGLRERDARATFFMIGQQIPGNEDLLQQMAADGHQLGDHTYTHAQLSKLTPDLATEEIRKTETLLEKAVGPDEFWLRPPYGLIDKAQAAVVKTPMVYWSVDPEDWKVLDTQKVVDHVLSHVKPGSIVLLHDFYPTSVDAALILVDKLQAEGYTFVTVEELFSLQGIEPQTGHLYATAEREIKIH